MIQVNRDSDESFDSYDSENVDLSLASLRQDIQGYSINVTVLTYLGTSPGSVSFGFGFGSDNTVTELKRKNEALEDEVSR